MSSFKLVIPKVDETYRSGSSADLSALPSVPDVLPGSAAERALQLCATVAPPSRPQPPPESLLDALVTRSAAFPLPWPVAGVRCARLLQQPDIDKETLVRNVDSAYPVMHEKALYLLVSFLEFKRQHGSGPERALYADMTLPGLVDRLLQRRAAAFFGERDVFLLQDGTKGQGGWELVGTDEEQPPLVLSSCLSYDEIKLSALLSVSSHSVFTNDGRRNNRGAETDDVDSFQRHGVIVGIIGSRLRRPGFMEYQEIIVSRKQNVAENGYGHETPSSLPACKWRQIFAAFYGVQPNFPLYEEALEMHQKDVKQSGVVRGSGGIDRYVELQVADDTLLFDNMLYQRRMSVTFETLLLEAASRAEAAGTTALVHIVGAGLGVWRISSHQERHFLDAFGSCIQRLLPSLSRISEVRFAWFSEGATLRGIGDGGRVGHVRVRFSLDEPQSRLLDNPEQLLVVSYAWDGNALPGNEFWYGNLSSSGDPAAACCSQITELHTASINSDRVCSRNLHIASSVWGVLHVSEYARRMLKATTSGGGQPPDSD